MSKLLKPLAILAVLGFPIAVAGYRLNLFEFGVSFKIMTWTAYLAAAVFFVGMLVTFIKRRSNPGLSKTARVASYIALLPLLGLGSQVFVARSVPAIHNISTDTVNPPAFDKVSKLRTPEHNPLTYASEELADIQQASYPQVKTLLSDLSFADAHARALELAESNGWDIVSADAAAGQVEATHTSLIWGFKDDVVVRILERGDKRAVDLRSVSRIGRSDLGKNAKRISKFLADF